MGRLRGAAQTLPHGRSRGTSEQCGGILRTSSRASHAHTTSCSPKGCPRLAIAEPCTNLDRIGPCNTRAQKDVSALLESARKLIAPSLMARQASRAPNKRRKTPVNRRDRRQRIQVALFQGLACELTYGYNGGVQASKLFKGSTLPPPPSSFSRWRVPAQDCFSSMQVPTRELSGHLCSIPSHPTSPLFLCWAVPRFGPSRSGHATKRRTRAANPPAPGPRGT